MQENHPSQTQNPQNQSQTQNPQSQTQSPTQNPTQNPQNPSQSQHFNSNKQKLNPYFHKRIKNKNNPNNNGNNLNNRNNLNNNNPNNNLNNRNNPNNSNYNKYNRNNQSKRIKNTECFEPMKRPVDMRIIVDNGRFNDKMSVSLTTRDVLLASNIFSDFKSGELYDKLVDELNNCGVPEEKLLKLWHGNDKIEGTHLIADDKTRWKNECPTFQLIINRIRDFFNMDIQATRCNWYKDTSQWKPFHFDAAAVKPDKADVQNFTVAVSFGVTREAAFEHGKTKTVISMPQPDGTIYAFSKDTNIIWRHGILQDKIIKTEGRISIIAWGWVDNMIKLE